jgi:chitinase
VLFRNSGNVKATLNFDAFASMQFSTGRVELFGLQNFGATFSVPGIVTIGPNLRVYGVGHVLSLLKGHGLYTWIHG